MSLAINRRFMAALVLVIGGLWLFAPWLVLAGVSPGTVVLSTTTPHAGETIYVSGTCHSNQEGDVSFAITTGAATREVGRSHTQSGNYYSNVVVPHDSPVGMTTFVITCPSSQTLTRQIEVRQAVYTAPQYQQHVYEKPVYHPSQKTTNIPHGAVLTGEGGSDNRALLTIGAVLAVLGLAGLGILLLRLRAAQ